MKVGITESNTLWIARSIRPIALMAVVVTVVGCNKPDNELPLSLVTGKVTLDGKPLPKGIVAFTPEHGHGATGVIQQDGSFTLSTYLPGDGAVVGIHQVTVSAWTSERIEGPNKSLIPIRYNSPESSRLTCEVRLGKMNEVVLDLKSQ